MKRNTSLIIASILALTAFGILSTKQIENKESKIMLAKKGIDPNHMCTGFADPNTGIAYCTVCGKRIFSGGGTVVF